MSNGTTREASLPLFDYPRTPGYAKGRETSMDAAEAIAPKAAVLREKTLRALSVRDMTADEVAEFVGVDRLAIRPRCSELSGKGKIVDTGVRRANKSGKMAIVWGIVK